MGKRGTWTAAAFWVVACGLVAAGGCALLETEAEPAKATSVYEGLSPQARRFLQQWAEAEGDEASRTSLRNAHRWPHRGPREADLLELAAAEAVRRSEALFMGARTVVFEDMHLSPLLREAVLAVRAEADVRSGDGAPFEQDATAVRVRVGPTEYYAGGDAAIVPVVLRRGRPWAHTEEVLCAFRSERWALWRD